MATKRYVVREGFNFRTVDARGNEKVYSEGDSLTLEQEVGDGAHQLEYLDDKDKTAALKLEEARAKSVKVDLPAAVAGTVSIDHAALGEAISQGIAAAFAKFQEPVIQDASGAQGTADGQGKSA